MFDIGWTELMLIGVVALIVIGPKELPGVLRSLGKGLATVRKMAGEFQGQFQEALREAELDGLKKEVDDLRSTAASLNPLNPIRNELSSIEQSIKDPLALDSGAATPSVDADGGAGGDTPSVKPAASGQPATQTAPAAAKPPAATPAEPTAPAQSAPATLSLPPLPEPPPPLTEKDFLPATPKPVAPASAPAPAATPAVPASGGTSA
jgi:sec-independent protein translocase protein TatB